jgi:integrase
VAHYRKLPSGRWQAVVKLPDGRQVTRTDPLKRVVQAWAGQVEVDARRGKWQDPRPARRTTVGDWHARWDAARVVEPTTRRKDESRWRVHLEPRWGDVPLAEVRRHDVQVWVRQLVDAGAGAHTVAGCVALLGTLLQGAVTADLIAGNPARAVKLPNVDAGRLRWFDRGEVAAILRHLPGQYRTLVDLGCHTGLRWGELTGLDASAVDFARAELHVRQVLTPYGLRQYAKSRRSHRTVPVPGHLLAGLSTVADEGLVFRGPGGGALRASNFRERAWGPALRAAGVEHAPPHTMRHTAASWLVMAGVDLYRVQALLGHESFTTTQRYAHLAPTAHDVVRAAWAEGARMVHGNAEEPGPLAGTGL